jgi:hypothetical protein
VKGKAVKLKPTKPKHPSRKGKKIYTDEVIASLPLIRDFFRYKCGKLPAPLMRRQMDYIALRPAFGISPAVRDKLMRISPATIDRVLRKDKAAPILRGKSLTKSAALLKHRISIRTFYTSGERKLPGFIRIDTARHCGQTTSGRYILTLTTTGVASGYLHVFPSSTRPVAGPSQSSGMSTRTSPSPSGSSTAITVVGFTIRFSYNTT